MSEKTPFAIATSFVASEHYFVLLEVRFGRKNVTATNIVSICIEILLTKGFESIDYSTTGGAKSLVMGLIQPS